MIKKFKKRKSKPKAGLESRWSELIKKLAGYRCELTRQDYDLHSHHIGGKSTNLLRFSLLSGICLSRAKHLYGIHNSDKTEDVRNEIIKVRPITSDGLNIYERLNFLKHQGHSVTLQDCQAYISQMEILIDSHRYSEIDWIVPQNASVKY